MKKITVELNEDQAQSVLLSLTMRVLSVDKAIHDFPDINHSELLNLRKAISDARAEILRKYEAACAGKKI